MWNIIWLSNQISLFMGNVSPTKHRLLRCSFLSSFSIVLVNFICKKYARSMHKKGHKDSLLYIMEQTFIIVYLGIKPIDYMKDMTVRKLFKSAKKPVVFEKKTMQKRFCPFFCIVGT